MDNKTKIQKIQLKNTLEALDKYQFKLFLNIIVHYWANYKFFMSKMNFFHLWCELNELCHETDESFPDQHTDHKLMKDFCIKHPYYFVDILDLGLVKKLFWEYMDQDLDTIIDATIKLHREGLRAAYEYINEAMGLSEDADKLVSNTEEHMKEFS
jgi:hypothetical protein